MTTRHIDGLVIVGGGLAGCLAALALKRWRPDVSFLLVEEGTAFGGNHLWSFFDTDVADADRPLVEPLVEYHWPGHLIAFPERRRWIRIGYNSIPSERLDRIVRETLAADQYLLGERVQAVRPTEIILDGGRKIVAQGVVDARGPANLGHLDLGWQKFLGREYCFAAPHRVALPVIMDATVDQRDGYRFVYLLPFDEHRLFVEDTYYSDSPQLDVAEVGRRIDDYVARHGWGEARVEREETGVLAVVMGGDFGAFWRAGGARVGKLGARGGLFHPTTSYSLPDAVRTARLLADQRSFAGDVLHDLLEQHAARLWKERGFFRTLNSMLMRAADPPERYRVLQHFYRLNPGTVARFYAGESTLFDKLRVLSGKPPVPVSRALGALKAAR